MNICIYNLIREMFNFLIIGANTDTVTFFRHCIVINPTNYWSTRILIASWILIFSGLMFFRYIDFLDLLMKLIQWQIWYHVIIKINFIGYLRMIKLSSQKRSNSKRFREYDCPVYQKSCYKDN